MRKLYGVQSPVAVEYKNRSAKIREAVAFYDK